MSSLWSHVNRLIRNAPWTLGLSAAVVALNWGVIAGATATTGGKLIELLQYDREAVLRGELWRILTGNLVHWSAAQLLLDVGAFLVVGLLFERSLRRIYPGLLLASALAVGIGLLAFAPEATIYRGLSGIDSGQFAIGVVCELRRGRNWRERLLPLAAAALLTVKMLFEAVTGTMFFGTEGLGDIGLPLPLAHIAGTLGAIAFVFVRVHRSRKRDALPPRRRRNPTDCGDSRQRELATSSSQG